MSEIVRALLADNCAHKRLMIRTAKVEGGNTAEITPEVGQFQFKYDGNGIFYPQAVYSSCYGTQTGGVNKGGPTLFLLSLHDQHDALILPPAFFNQTGNLNAYFDNLDSGWGLGPKQFFNLHYTLFVNGATVAATFIGTEFLFDDDIDLRPYLNAAG